MKKKTCVVMEFLAQVRDIVVYQMEVNAIAIKIVVLAHAVMQVTVVWVSERCVKMKKIVAVTRLV